MYTLYEVKIRIKMNIKQTLLQSFLLLLFKQLLPSALFRRKREKKYSKNLPSHLEEFFYTYRLYSIIDFRGDKNLFRFLAVDTHIPFFLFIEIYGI